MKIHIPIFMFLILLSCSEKNPDWDQALKDNSVEGYTAFLKKYPNGKFAAKANKKIAELTGNIIWDNNKKGYFIDIRDNQKYKVVKIGEQIWMAENLNYKSENSWCFNNDTTNCTEYGRLYDWKTAQEVCPNDWRLPIKAEYKELLDCIGGNTEKKCKALLPGGSTGFSYKSLGHRIIEEDKFKYVKGVGHPTISKFISTANGFYWTSSAKDNENAYFLLINGLDNISIVYSDKRWGLAVRCIYDKADN